MASFEQVWRPSVPHRTIRVLSRRLPETLGRTWTSHPSCGGHPPRSGRAGLCHLPTTTSRLKSHTRTATAARNARASLTAQRNPAQSVTDLSGCTKSVGDFTPDSLPQPSITSLRGSCHEPHTVHNPDLYPRRTRGRVAVQRTPCPQSRCPRQAAGLPPWGQAAAHPNRGRQGV
jgi:hypothetical protein